MVEWHFFFSQASRQVKQVFTSVNVSFGSTMGSEKDGEVAQQKGNLKSASPTHFKSTIVGIALPQPMAFENETSQMSREA